jgi:hypothetical protein
VRGVHLLPSWFSSQTRVDASAARSSLGAADAPGYKNPVLAGLGAAHFLVSLIIFVQFVVNDLVASEFSFGIFYFVFFAVTSAVGLFYKSMVGFFHALMYEH